MRRFSFARFPFSNAHASLLAALVSATLLTSCIDSHELGTSPPSGNGQPAEPIAGTASVAGFVVDTSQNCVVGALVKVMDGPQAGEQFTQTRCGFWDYDTTNGFLLQNLPVGTAVTIRATADGYKPADVRVQPSVSYSYSTMIVLTPP